MWRRWMQSAGIRWRRRRDRTGSRYASSGSSPWFPPCCGGAVRSAESAPGAPEDSKRDPIASTDRLDRGRADRESQEDAGRDGRPEKEFPVAALYECSLSAAVLLAVVQNPRPQRGAIVAGRLHGLLCVLACALAGGEFEVFGRDISFVRRQRECQDDVVSFGATHRVSLSRLSRSWRGTSHLAANWGRRQVLQRPIGFVTLG